MLSLLDTNSHFALSYQIAGNIGGHNIWQICHERHLAGFKFGRFRVPDPNDVTKWQLHCDLSLLPVVSGTAKCLVALAGPFSAAYLPISLS